MIRVRVLDRDVVLSALTGSWNYNLQQTEEAVELGFKPSDKDYKIFVVPTFEELYKGKMYSKTIITDTVDQDIHDIRKLPELLWKSNIAYLELLFSDEVYYDSHQILNILDLRENIARINLPQLFKSTGGMFNNRMKKLKHATEGTGYLVDKFGYNTKEATQMFRTLNLLVRYEETNFTDFKNSLKYDKEDAEFLHQIKNGAYTEEEFVSFITLYHDKFFAPLKEKYCSNEPNEALKEHIYTKVMELVQLSLVI